MCPIIPRLHFGHIAGLVDLSTAALSCNTIIFCASPFLSALFATLRTQRAKKTVVWRYIRLCSCKNISIAVFETSKSRESVTAGSVLFGNAYNADFTCFFGMRSIVAS